MEVRISLRQEPGGRWVARAHGEDRITGSGATRDRCLASVRRALRRTLGGSAEPLTLLVETVPRLAGVAEAAEVMGWDKRRVITYIDRGRFPEPAQSLASGRVWVRSEIEEFARQWRARYRPRKKRKAR